MCSFLKIRKSEYFVTIVALVMILLLNELIISKFFVLFANYNAHSWNVFMRNFHMSGFDPITYEVVTDWKIGYNILRHPLLPFMMYPFYLANQLLWTLTGANCVQFVVGSLLVFCSFYSFIFIYRIIHDLISLSRFDSILLSLFFFSFSYIMVAIIVPDHFCLSLFLILLTLYRAGYKMKNKQQFSVCEMLILFVVTAGVTMSNGLIVFMAVLFTNGKKTFQPRLIVTAILSSVIILGIGTSLNALMSKANAPTVTTWVDTSTPRLDTVLENFFGESIQLHRESILGDVLVRRPVIVRYTWTAQYAVESIILLLFLVGLYEGRRSRFQWLNMACLLYAVLLHLVIGFAINEVYIMSVHWIYVIPISIAYIYRKSKDYHHVILLLRMCVIFLTIYLWCYNGILLYNYLTWPLIN